MKVINQNFQSIDALERELDLSGFDPKKTLVQVFTGQVSQESVERLQALLVRRCAGIPFIGATTAGEIYEGEIYEESINVSITAFEKSEVRQKSFLGREDDFALGEEIATAMVSEDTRALILLVDGLQTNASDLIDGIASVAGTLPVAGGLAGDDGAIERTFVFDETGVYEKGCVAAAFQSESLQVLTRYQLNWQAIGKTMTVTRAHKNRLYEIDGINASEIYTRYLGEKIGAALPHSATEFPLLKIEEDGNEVCRTFIHRFDDGSLLTIGNLEVGDRVRLAFGNVDLILKNTKKEVISYQAFAPEAIYLFSCAARKVFLQSEIVSELKPFNAIAPNIGFFTFGEIFHHADKNALLNMSLTVLALREHDTPDPVQPQRVQEEASGQNFMRNKHTLVLEVLTHLSNTVIAELEEAKRELQEQANRDYLTRLYNRRYFSEIAQELLYIAKRERRPFSVILLDIDRFKSINDTHGHHVGDDVIKAVANTIVATVRKSDVVARHGGEEFALLLPFTDTCGAQKIAEKIRKNVAGQRVLTPEGETVRFTISLGVAAIHPEDPTVDTSLNRADKALYRAKESGRNRVIVDG